MCYLIKGFRKSERRLIYFFFYFNKDFILFLDIFSIYNSNLNLSYWIIYFHTSFLVWAGLF